jgi:flavin reductase (DIM6/NTAB) family NADH-FMN oxidoreductase RutF
MVLLQERSQAPSRITLQISEISADTTVIRSLDWNRDRFDIEFELQNGTTYNSFILRGDKTALIDTSHQKFRTLYMDALKGAIDLSTLDYLIVSHTEPDHSGLVADDLVNTAAGIAIGMPSQENAVAQTNLSIILAAAHNKQAIGFFESGGDHDEPLYPLRNKFREVGVTELFPPILLKEPPTVALDQICEEAGTDLRQWLTRDRTVKQMKSLDTDLDRALGRLSGGLYIITARKGSSESEIASAMLASWVTQASLSPLGVAIAVAKDRAIEALLHCGDRFVLNVLEEDNYQPLMRHFLKRFPPGGDRFAGVKTYNASNGSPILADALAYMECEVTSRMDCGDHWVIYSSVQAGRVAKAQGMTAVHHRKVGNHY